MFGKKYYRTSVYRCFSMIGTELSTTNGTYKSGLYESFSLLFERNKSSIFLRYPSISMIAPTLSSSGGIQNLMALLLFAIL